MERAFSGFCFFLDNPKKSLFLGFHLETKKQGIIIIKVRREDFKMTLMILLYCELLFRRRLFPLWSKISEWRRTRPFLERRFSTHPVFSNTMAILANRRGASFRRVDPGSDDPALRRAAFRSGCCAVPEREGFAGSRLRRNSCRSASGSICRLTRPGLSRYALNATGFSADEDGSSD